MNFLKTLCIALLSKCVFVNPAPSQTHKWQTKAGGCHQEGPVLADGTSNRASPMDRSAWEWRSIATEPVQILRWEIVTDPSQASYIYIYIFKRKMRPAHASQWSGLVVSKTLGWVKLYGKACNAHTLKHIVSTVPRVCGTSLEKKDEKTPRSMKHIQPL